MSRIRRCSRCGRTRTCRMNVKAKCKGGVQALCLSCIKVMSDEWYQEHKEYKVEYSRQQYLGNTDWLKWVKANFRRLTPEQKLEALYDESYMESDIFKSQKPCPKGY